MSEGEYTKDMGVMRGPTDDEFTSLMNSKDPNRDAAYPLPSEEEIIAAQDGIGTIGSFQRAAALDEDEVEAVVDEELDEAATEEEVILGKFKSKEELEKAYVNLEKAYGSRAEEVNERRRLEQELAELRGQVTAYTSTAQRPVQDPITQATVDQIDESVFENPQGTVEWVLKNQPALYERAIQTWGQVDPLAATRYDTSLRLQAQQQAFDARLAATTQPAAALAKERQLSDAWTMVATNRPDLVPYANDLEVTLAANPWASTSLQNAASPQEAAAIIENLLYTTKGRSSEAVQEATEGAASEQQAAARSAKQRAGVSMPVNGGERAPRTAVSDLKKSMLATSPTSIHDELERNRTKAAKAKGR